MYDLIRKHRLLSSVILNALLLAYFGLLFYCVFETNDDYAMKMIAMGAYGQPDRHLVFINSILGMIPELLYKLLPSIPWYEGLQYLLIFCSLTAITYVLTEGEQSFHRSLLVYVVLFVAAHFFYVDLQYTKTAALLALAGYLLLDRSIRNDRLSGVICSVAMMVLARLLRTKQFYLVSLPCAALFLPMILSFLRNLKDKVLQKRMITLAVSAAVCFLLPFAVINLGALNYNEPSWRSYKTFNSVRSSLLDREEIDYESDSIFYDGLGLDETDLEMLYGLWDFDDPEVFTENTLRQIRDRRTAVRKDAVSVVKGLVSDTIYFFFENREGSLFSFLLIFGLIIAMGEKRSVTDNVSLLLSVIMSLFCIVYTYIYRNYSYLGRVHLSLLLTAIVLVLHKIRLPGVENRFVPCLLGVLMLTGALSFMWFDEFRINSSARIKDEQKISALQQIREDEDHLYLRTTDENLDYVSGLFMDDDVYNKENLYALGGWTINMPLNDAVKERYGVTNPFRDMVNNDKVYLIISDEEKLDLILKYVSKRYDSKARAEKVRTIQANKEYIVYRIISD